MRANKWQIFGAEKERWKERGSREEKKNGKKIYKEWKEEERLL